MKYSWLFMGLLQAVFVVLKIESSIRWSWWWVMAPTWIPVAVALSAWLIVLILTVEEVRRQRESRCAALERVTRAAACPPIEF